MVAAAAAVVLALVAQDQAPLHAAPRDSSPRQAVLWQGDVLEVRGERQGYLQVYDHRRERGGFVRSWMVRPYSATPEAAPELLSVVRFLRDAPGSEALGIGYAALFLRAADAPQIGSEAFDALGTMADRLARRASARFGKASDDALAAHLEVAQSYGLHFASYERGDRTVVCYDGEAFRRVLALPATEEQKTRAALALTRAECIDPNLSVVDRIALDGWRTEVLDRPQLAQLPPYLAQRLHVRRAGAWATVAFDREKKGDAASRQAAGKRALDELAGIDPAQLSEDDRDAYREAAIRVGASRWAAEDRVEAPGGLRVEVEAGAEPGQSCVKLVDAHHEAKAPLAQRCTFGEVWAASASASPGAHALALAVQPLASWRELWVFRQVAGKWDSDVLVPAPGDPEVGYLELAGWSPDGKRMLVARESRDEDGFHRSFEILKLDSLEVEKQASSPDALTPFHRWQSPEWRSSTVALR